MNEQEPGMGGGGKFDPTRHLRQLRGRGGSSDYLDVKWRLVWLRSEHPDAQITTEHVTITSDMAIFKAQVTIPGGGSATGYGSETAKDFGDFIEKAETKSLGRALIALGYGTQFAQEFGEDDGLDIAPPVRAMPPRPEPARAETPPAARPAAAPQPAVAQRQAAAPPSPRPEPIPADARRPTPVRPLRDADADLPAAPAPPPPATAAATDERDDDDPFASPPRLPESQAPANMPTSRAPTRLSPPQPAPRPAPRPSTAPAFTREPDEDAEEEAIDMANYGWTEFWSWARARGFNDRKSLDAVVGRPTNGMTPLEIRKHIQAAGSKV